MQQADLFTSGYSDTSRLAYNSNKSDKQRQAAMILATVKRLTATTLKQLEQVTGLPQSTCAGRVNDLIRQSLVKYNGTVEYSGRLRKQITLF